MVSKKPMDTKEITDLLSKLKAETPDYPSDLLAAKRAAFLKQAVNIKIDGNGQGGQQSGTGSSGTALGGGAVGPGVLQALIGISIVAAMLLAVYAYRDQITDVLQGNVVIAQEDNSQPSISPSPLAPETVTALPGPLALEEAAPPVEITSTVTSGASLDDTDINGASVVAGTAGAEVAAEKTKTNSGLHLGQTPGTPAAPGQGNPGNINKPEKPAKPTKPPKATKEPKDTKEPK